MLLQRTVISNHAYRTLAFITEHLFTTPSRNNRVNFQDGASSKRVWYIILFHNNPVFFYKKFRIDIHIWILIAHFITLYCCLNFIFSENTLFVVISVTSSVNWHKLRWWSWWRLSIKTPCQGENPKEILISFSRLPC